MLSAHDSEAEVTMRVAEQARGAAMSLPKKADEWRNARWNGRKFELSSWMRENSFKVGDDGASSVLTGRGERAEEEEVKTSPRKTWKVPGKGTLEFDYHTAHPCETLIEHLTFDLQKPREKAAFLDLWTRASHLRGQNLWNCKLGTRVMQIPESLYYEKQLLSMLPSSGILSFDYIYCVPKESTKWMARFSMRLQNLTDRKDRADLATLVQRAACSTVKDEFMINIRVNDGIISQSKLASETGECLKGIDYIRYHSILGITPNSEGGFRVHF